MSLQKYIQKKFHQIKVNYDLSEYKVLIQDHCFSAKSKRDLYEYFLDLEDISRDLDIVKYPDKFKILLNVSSPDNSHFLQAFENFFDWSSTRNGSKIRKLEEKITNLKSFYFLKEDVNLNDVEFVTDAKCSKALNNFKILDIYVDEAVQDTDFSNEEIIIRITNENLCKIQINDNVLDIAMKDNKPCMLSEKISGHDKNFMIVRDNLFLPRNNYYDFYFQESAKNREYIKMFKRNYYLNRHEEYFEYPLSRGRLPRVDEYDLWKIKLKLDQIIYDENAFRVKNFLQKVRYLELEEAHES